MPTTGKLDKTRVAKLHSAMCAHVEQGEVPGVATLIARGDDIHVAAAGVKSLHGSDPMRRDTIFRIASMTKPITAAATMVLVDDRSKR
jgi:CubicO group peptidase (beta-lactamase class C family)